MIRHSWIVAIAVCARSIVHADEPVAPPAATSAELPTAASDPHTIDPCSDAGVAPRLASLLSARRFADAHHAAVGLRVLCGSRGLADRWRLYDSVALLRLEDRAYALANLHELAAGSQASVATVLLAWAYVDGGDHRAARTALAKLPPPRAAAIRALGQLDDADAFAHAITGLDDRMRARAIAIERRYRDARERSPAFAGVLSALLPGTGQLYAGSFQAAAVTFVLNGLFIGATVELARERHYFTATAAGTVASFFYVGGIMNAVDLARRRNALAMQPHADQLEQLLVPELGGQF
ncbi:MAG: hypothetical protein AB7R00_23510 [Kofleriaceae bacterium]